MKTITDHELLKITEDWVKEAPLNIGLKTAFAAGYRMAESNKAEADQLGKGVITCCGFLVGDKVNTPFGEGEVWKITETSVHVKHWHGAKNCPHNWVHSKYLTEVTHHKQSHVSALSYCKQP